METKLTEEVALEPCPFCGGPAVNVGELYIKCGTPFNAWCPGLEIKAARDVNFKEAWNTRATIRAHDAKPTGELAEIEKCIICDGSGQLRLEEGRIIDCWKCKNQYEAINTKSAYASLKTINEYTAFNTYPRALSMPTVRALYLSVIERDKAVSALRASEERVRELEEALQLHWHEATGQFSKKSCGHHFTCVCVGQKIEAALASVPPTKTAGASDE